MGVVGLVLTLVFGSYTIWAKRKSQKKVSLGFEKKECYSLFKKDISRLHIDIKYQGNTVDNYLILFKGSISNNGHSDVDKTRIYKPLLIKTKDEYKWLEANVSDTPDGANVSLVKINETTLELNWDLLKREEQIEFEALIEIPQNKEIEEITEDFYNSIDFDFRITDVNKIEKLSEVNPKEKIRNRRKSLQFFLGIFFFIAGLYIIFNPELPASIAFFRDIQKIEFELASANDITFSSISVLHNGLLELEIEGEGIEMPIIDFNKEYKINSITTTKSKNLFLTLFSRIAGGFYILMSFMAFFLYFKFKRVKLPKTNAKIL